MTTQQVDDERFMREALIEAQRAAAEGEVPIGAVVVHESAIIARGRNRRERDADPSAHAEFSALVDAARALGRWRLTGCTVYVTLEPCLMCAGLMVNARVDRCVYGAADPKGGALGTLYDVSRDARLNHAFSVTAGVCAEECADVLRTFFAQLRGKAAPEVASGPNDENAGVDAKGAAAICCQAAAANASARAPEAPGAPASSAPHIVLAIDSFKGSATSAQAEAWLAEGIRRTIPDAAITALPVADGGEGTVEAVHAARGGNLRTAAVHDLHGHSCSVPYLLLAEQPAREERPAASFATSQPPSPAASSAQTPTRRHHSPLHDAPMPIALIQAADPCGIARSDRTHETALAASSCGVGDLILRAIADGAQTVCIGLGGTATVDGGAGMLRALGARLLDATGAPVAPGLRGLRDVASIDLVPAREALGGVRLIALNDVTNPLVGARGAVRVFGPQKGLARGLPDHEREAALAACDRWMAAYGARLTAARDALDGAPLQVAQPGKRPVSLGGVPGSGAAGGLGAALLALGAQLVPGIDAVLDLVGFDHAIRGADAVITGEGNLDGQTAAGKAPVGVAWRAKAARPDIPVIAVCGGRGDELDEVYDQGIDLVLPVLRRPCTLEEALSEQETRENLICAGETAARVLLLPQATRR